MALEEFTRGDPKAVAKWNAPIKAINAGIVADSADIAVGERLPNGQVTLRLKRKADGGSEDGETVTVPEPPSSGVHILTANAGAFAWFAVPTSGNHVLTVQGGALVAEAIADC